MVMKETVDKANASATQEARSSVLKLSPEGEREEGRKRANGLVKFLSFTDSQKPQKLNLNHFFMILTRAFSPGPRADKNPTPRVAPPTMPACPSKG